LIATREDDDVSEETVANNTSTPDNAPVNDPAETSVSEEWEKKIQDYVLALQRERADFQNYRKRSEARIKDSEQNGAVEAFTALLPVLDDFELAMSNLPADLKDHAWVNGIAGIQRKFLRLLEERGVSLIDPTGKPFDPNFQEAITTEPSDTVESGHVIVTLRKGYAYGERILRTALVRVAN